MQKIIVSTGVGGLSLSRAVVEDLFLRRPELFDDEPIPVEAFRLDETEPVSRVLERFWNAVAKGQNLYFLKTDFKALRTDPILVKTLEEEGDSALRVPSEAPLSLVGIPDGVDWYIFILEDGSELVCEKSRVWRPQKISREEAKHQ